MNEADPGPDAAAVDLTISRRDLLVRQIGQLGFYARPKADPAPGAAPVDARAAEVIARDDLPHQRWHTAQELSNHRISGCLSCWCGDSTRSGRRPPAATCVDEETR